MMSERQQVLAIPARGVSAYYRRGKFYKRDLSDFWSFVAEEGKFVDREWAETTESVKQLIACAVVTNGRRVLCARRTRKSNRPALALRWTLMFGGHVDDADARFNDPIKICVVREIEEELGIKPKIDPVILGLVVDPATKVGRLHLGVVFLVYAELDCIYLNSKLDTAEFVKPGGRKPLDFLEPSALWKINKAGRFDPWSEIFFHSWPGRKIINFPGRNEQELDLVWTEHLAGTEDDQLQPICVERSS
jgi:predicted NUDIX family phosphoesterase